jgi:hypothetical protein
MIAEIFPDLYDIHGRRVFHPGTRGRRMGFRPTAPMGRYMTQPLKTVCKDFAEMRKFLSNCRGRDMSEIQRRDYWQPPEEFEKTRVGDCVDFGLWTWRQVLAMGYPARFVGGKAGKFGEGHAWVTFEKDGKWYLLEPQFAILGLRMPRISTLRYHPRVSVAWDGEKIQYFDHEDRNTDPPLRRVPSLLAEWAAIWTPFWVRFSYRFPIALVRRIWRRVSRLRGSR